MTPSRSDWYRAACLTGVSAAAIGLVVVLAGTCAEDPDPHSTAVGVFLGAGLLLGLALLAWRPL